MENLRNYNIWKADTNGNPIEGSDRILSARSKRKALKHIADEIGIPYDGRSLIIRCPDGSFYNASPM